MKKRWKTWLGGALLALFGLVAFSQCGGSVCGNGKKEGGEECDAGKLNGAANSGCSSECKIASLNVAGLEVFVTRLVDASVGYEGASCTDLKAAKMHLVVTGPDPSFPYDMMLPCDPGSQLWPSVTPGAYQATVTLLDTSGAALTKPKASATMNAALGSMTMLSINFTKDDFLKQDYTGTLYFKPSWGEDATTCTMASPMVTEYGVKLTDDSGNAVSAVSTANRTMDGTAAACFVPSSNGTSEAVTNLAWGYYNLAFTGYVDATDVGYCGSFRVFNGPSAANQTYSLTVPYVASADAGACP